MFCNFNCHIDFFLLFCDRQKPLDPASGGSAQELSTPDRPPILVYPPSSSATPQPTNPLPQGIKPLLREQSLPAAGLVVAE